MHFQPTGARSLIVPGARISVISLLFFAVVAPGCGAGATGTKPADAASGSQPSPDAATVVPLGDGGGPRSDAAGGVEGGAAGNVGDARPPVDAAGGVDSGGAGDARPPVDAVGGVDSGSAGDARASADAAIGVDAGPTGSAGDTRPSADAPVQLAEVVGFYSGDWGAMVLRIVGDEVRGTYTHDEGTIVGTFRDGVLYAWWSEVPSRLPSADAGECEFRFLRKDGRVFIDGRWRYGTTEPWREDWDIGQVDGQAPDALVARFADAAAFKAHP